MGSVKTFHRDLSSDTRHTEASKCRFISKDFKMGKPAGGSKREEIVERGLEAKRKEGCPGGEKNGNTGGVGRYRELSRRGPVKKKFATKEGVFGAVKKRRTPANMRKEKSRESARAVWRRITLN